MEKTKYKRPKGYIFKRKVKEPQIKIAKEIIDIVNNYYDLEISTKGRKQLYTLPRQIAQYLINDYCNLLVEQDIATITNLRSHCTIRNSIRKIEDYLEFDKEIINDVLILRSEINAKIDLRITSKSLVYRKERELDLIRVKILKLDDVQYFDLIDTINNHLNNYKKWSA